MGGIRERVLCCSKMDTKTILWFNTARINSLISYINMTPRKNMGGEWGFEQATDASKERENQPDTTCYLISDIHGLPEDRVERLLDRLSVASGRKQKDAGDNAQKFTVLMGDLPSSDTQDEIIRQFKSAQHNKTRLNFADPEEEQTFDRIVEKRGWRAGAYLSAKLNTPKKVAGARDEALGKNRKVAERLARLPNPIVFPGNAETNAVYGSVGAVYEENGVPYYQEPRVVDLGERALVIWPSFKDPKSYSGEDKRKFKELMTSKTRELADLLANKKEVLIITHEQPFYGSRQYKELVEKAGYKAYGAPFNGVNPSREYIMRLIGSLPKNSKIGIAFGHLHSPEQAVVAGTGLKLEQTGTGGMGNFKVTTKPVDGGEANTKGVEFFYIPQDEVGVVTIGKEGFRFEVAK